MNLADARTYTIQLAQEAGEILKKYFKARNFSIRRKTNDQIVTQADEEVDQFLRSNLQKKYPQSQFLTEETAPDDYSDFKNAENLWIIDPLDGTTNFSRGYHSFGIEIALVIHKHVQLGVAYLPLTDKMYWAQSDKKNAMCNDKSIFVSSINSLNRALITINWPWNEQIRQKHADWVDALGEYTRNIRSLGSSVIDLTDVAQGRSDANIESGVKPWDVAAAGFIALKAGGRVTRINGEPWDIFSPDILAANPELHAKILKLITLPRSTDVKPKANG